MRWFWWTDAEKKGFDNNVASQVWLTLKYQFLANISRRVIFCRRQSTNFIFNFVEVMLKFKKILLTSKVVQSDPKITVILLLPRLSLVNPRYTLYFSLSSMSLLLSLSLSLSLSSMSLLLSLSLLCLSYSLSLSLSLSLLWLSYFLSLLIFLSFSLSYT